MNNFYKALHILILFHFLITACRTRTVPVRRAEQSAQKEISYEVVIGKSMTDKAVIDFLVDHHCFPAARLQLCEELGMALWADSDQVVRAVYLYAGGATGFKRYRGELPFDLTFYDPMWRVQEKLRKLNMDDSSYDAGLPDEAGSPDHIHYWAVYRRLGMTVIYDAASADQDAYIYAILMNK